MSEFLHKDLTYQIIGAAMEVHRHLGPGFLESVYQKSLAYELEQRDIQFIQQKHLPVSYKGILTVGDFIADIVVEDCIILELKAIDLLHARHEAQALNYLTVTGFRLALLLNFGNKTLQYKRIIR